MPRIKVEWKIEVKCLNSILLLILLDKENKAQMNYFITGLNPLTSVKLRGMRDRPG